MSTKIDLGQLHPQQLVELKKNTEEEINHFTSSLQALQTVQQKLRDCIKYIDEMSSQASKELLIPLTSSLYLPGEIKDNKKFLVDIGTGYYAEKTDEDARKMYEGKIAKLTEDSGKLKDILMQKNEILNQLNLVLRRKVLEMEKQPQSQAV